MLATHLPSHPQTPHAVGNSIYFHGCISIYGCTTGNVSISVYIPSLLHNYYIYRSILMFNYCKKYRNPVVIQAGCKNIQERLSNADDDNEDKPLLTNIVNNN